MRVWRSESSRQGSPEITIKEMSSRGRDKIAVILAAHGEAETTRFMENYRVTRQTLAHASLVIPIASSLQKTIAVTASLKKLIQSRTDAQCSPHNRITREQVAALQCHLDLSPSSEVFEFEVHAAFSASRPYVETIIEKTRCSDGQVIVSMAPIDTSLSCGQLCAYLSKSRSHRDLWNVKVLSRFWDDERLSAIYCDHVFEKSPMSPTHRNEKRILLLLFHGTLVADTKGELPQFRTGREETISFAERLQQIFLRDSRNPYDRIMTAYLNHNVGGEWTKPSFEEVCSMLRDESSVTVDLFCCGYFADGNETIRRAAVLGSLPSVSEATSIPCVNSSSAFTAYLTSRVVDAARQIMSFR